MLPYCQWHQLINNINYLSAMKSGDDLVDIHSFLLVCMCTCVHAHVYV